MDKSVWQRLQDWFNGPLGAFVIEQEQTQLEQVVPEMFGYHIVQVGSLHGGRLLDSSRIGHRVLVAIDNGPAGGDHAALRSVPDALPIASDCLDVVLLPHVLEFAGNPHGVLREVERVLIGEGHVVLLGFNPWSLWGLWRLALGWREDPPWCGHFYGLSRVRDWLSLLDFEVIGVRRFFYRPPSGGQRFMRRLAFMDKLGKHVWPVAGAVYMIVAKKRIVPLTPVRMRWRARRSMIASGVAEPSARMAESGK